MDNELYLQKISEDIKILQKKVDDISGELTSRRDQRFRCLTNFDERYIHRDEFNDRFKESMETYSDKKLKKVNTSIDIFKSIMQICAQVGPYIVIIVGFYNILNKIG